MGAGPAGLALAAELARAGADVLVLEAADETVCRDSLETVRNVGMRYDLPNQRGRGIGGGARLWNLGSPLGGPRLRLREMDHEDFLRRPDVRETSWPLTKESLEGAYAAAWALFDLPGFQQDVPRTRSSALAAESPSGADGREGESEERLFGLGPAAVFTERLPRVLEASPAARVVTGAVVTDIRTDRDLGTVSSLTCASANGPFSVEASEFVLAGGAVENARLLLAARSRHTAGIGNASGHVGRWFMEHPHLDSALVRPLDQRLDRDQALWDIHVRDGVPVMLMRALPSDIADREGLLSTAYYLRPRPVTSPVFLRRDGAVSLRRMATFRTWRTALGERRMPPRADVHLADALTLPSAMRWVGSQAWAAALGPRRIAPPRAMMLRAMSEQVPNSRSQVRLTAERDRFGVPTAELDWQLTDQDWQSLLRSQQLIGPRLGTALGACVDGLLGGELPARIVGGAHQMGTTRMAAAERDGVVDADCRVHGTTNLYVAGASVFPTVGSANPTLTVVALALRLANHLQSRSGATVSTTPH